MTAPTHFWCAPAQAPHRTLSLPVIGPPTLNKKSLVISKYVANDDIPLLVTMKLMMVHWADISGL